MNISKNNIDALNCTITVTLEKSDYQEKVDKTLKDYRKKVSLNGFRQGNAPMGLIKKQYEKPVTADVINKMLDENLFKYLHDEKIEFLGGPLPSLTHPEVNFDKDEKLNFVFDVALAPQFNVAIDNSLDLTNYNILVEDADVDKYYQQYKASAGKSVAVDASDDKSMIKGEVYALDNVEITNKTSVLVEMIKDEEIKAQFIGKKAGDEIKFDLKKAFPNEADAKAMIGNKDLDWNNITTDYVFKIESCENFVPGELTQEYYDKFFGKDVIHNDDELKARIKEDIAKSYQTESDYKIMIDAQKALTENAKFDLPLDFMIRWMLSMEKYQDYTRERLETEFPTLENDLKWNLIQNKLVKENNIEVSADEELEEAKAYTAAEFQRYGIAISQLPGDMLDNFAKERLAKEQEKNMIRNTVINKKLTSVVKAGAKLTKKDISYADFAKLFEN